MNDPVSMFSITSFLIAISGVIAITLPIETPVIHFPVRAGRQGDPIIDLQFELCASDRDRDAWGESIRGTGDWSIRITGVRTPEGWAIASARRRTTL